MRKPLAVVGLTFFITLAGIGNFGYNTALVGGIFLLVFFAAIMFIKALRTCAIPFVVFAALGACFLYVFSFNMYVRPVASLENITANVSARILSYSKNKDNCCYTAKIENFSFENAPENVKVRLYSDVKFDCDIGDIADMKLTFYNIEKSQKSYCYPDGIYINAYINNPQEITFTKADSRPLAYYTDKIRTKTTELIDRYVSGDTAAVIKGVFLSDKTTMSDNLYYDTKTCGVSHVFAVSGLHASTVGSIIILMFNILKIKRRIATPVSVLFVWAFIGVAGFPFSAIRAAIMFTIYAAGIAIFKKADALNSLGFSLLVLLIINPFAAMDIGLLSSALSCIGLITLEKPLHQIFERPFRKRAAKKALIGKMTENEQDDSTDMISHEQGVRILTAEYGLSSITRSLIGSAAATTAALIGLIPCTVLYYKTFSFVAFFANFLILPAAWLLMIFILTGLLLSFIPGVRIIAPGFLLLGGLAAKHIGGVIWLLAKIPYASIPVYRPYFILVAAGCFFIAATVLIINALWRSEKIRFVRLGCILCALLSVCGICSYNVLNRNVAEIYVIHTKKSEAVLLHCDNYNALICSNAVDCKYEVSDIMKAFGSRKIDFVGLTGSASRSFFGEKSVLNGNIEIGSLVVPPGLSENITNADSGSDNGTTKICEYKNFNFSFSNESSIDFLPDSHCIIFNIGDTKALITLPGCNLDNVPAQCYNILISTENTPLFSDNFHTLSDTSTILPQSTVITAETKKGLAAATALSTAGIKSYVTGQDGVIRIRTRGKQDILLERVTNATD